SQARCRCNRQAGIRDHDGRAFRQRESVMARREFSRKIKQAALARAAGYCEKCRAALKTGEGEIDHILPDILGGEPVLANAQVLCRTCHSEKTADDIRRTREADRQRDKNNGAIKPSSKLAKPVKQPKRLSKPLPPRKRDIFGRPVSEGSRA